jgi:hypothetical protein
MALESVEPLAVRTRLSESHCHPPREMRNGGMDGVAMRAITAHRAWPLHADDWRSCGWCASEGDVAFEGFHAVEQVVECPPSSIAARVEKKIELDHSGGRMARIEMRPFTHPPGGCIRGITKVDVQEARRQASAGEPASAVQPSANKARTARARARAASRRGVGQRRCSIAASRQASIRLKASEQVEARHHQKQHIIPPTNMAASCIFCKIIKGRLVV